MSQKGRQFDANTPSPDRASDEGVQEPDDAAWKDRLAVARAQREAVLAQRAQDPAPATKKKLKPWERAEVAAAERRKLRKETGYASRLQDAEPAPLILSTSAPAALPLAAAISPEKLNETSPPFVAADSNKRDRRLWWAAALFLVGLGVGFGVAAPDRITAGIDRLQALLSVPSNVAPLANPSSPDVVEARPQRATPLVGFGGQGPSDVALGEVATGQAAFRVGPPEPFTERSGAPMDVAQAFFAETLAPRMLAKDRISHPETLPASLWEQSPERATALTVAPGSSAPAAVAVALIQNPSDEVAQFLRYSPFQPSEPPIGVPLEAVSQQPPSVAFGVTPPVAADRVTNLVQLSSSMGLQTPGQSGVILGGERAARIQFSAPIAELLAPEGPSRLDLGETPIRLAALTDGSRLDFESPRVTAALVPSGAGDTIAFARTASALSVARAPMPLSSAVGAPQPIVLRQTFAPAIGSAPEPTAGIQMASLWLDEGVDGSGQSLDEPLRVTAYAPEGDVTLPPEPVGKVAFPNVSVVLWAPNATSDDRIEQVDDGMRGAGFEVGEAQRIDIRITQDQVRYFHASSAKAAAVLADTIGARLRDFTGFRPSPEQGTIEVWLRGDAAPAQVARAPASAPRPTRAQREQQQLQQVRSRLLQRLQNNNF